VPCTIHCGYYCCWYMLCNTDGKYTKQVLGYGAIQTSIMGSTFGLAFSISNFIFFILICPGTCKIRGMAYGWRTSDNSKQGFVTSFCINIYHRVVHTIFLMVTWLSFLRYVITYNKDKHNRWKLIRNLSKFVDIHRCINLYKGKLYCVWNIYGVRCWILVYVNICLMMYLINFCLCVWWL
jgi:hypothetical protein